MGQPDQHYQRAASARHLKLLRSARNDMQVQGCHCAERGDGAISSQPSQNLRGIVRPHCRGRQQILALNGHSDGLHRCPTIRQRVHSRMMVRRWAVRVKIRLKGTRSEDSIGTDRPGASNGCWQAPLSPLRAGRGPGKPWRDWIPAFAGMTWEWGATMLSVKGSKGRLRSGLPKN